MNIWLIGGGGHGKVVLSALLQQGMRPLGIYDTTPDLEGKSLWDVPYVSATLAANNHKDFFHIAIGSNKARKDISQELSPQGWQTIIHPKAIVDPKAKLGHGTFVSAGAIINADAKIGNHVIINTGAIIEHDVVIEDYAHISPGTVLTGGAFVGEGTLVGANSVVIPQKKIGEWAVIGAGSSIVQDIPSHVTAMGVPCKPR